jgi:hypothetical protein
MDTTLQNKLNFVVENGLTLRLDVELFDWS